MTQPTSPAPAGGQQSGTPAAAAAPAVSVAPVAPAWLEGVPADLAAFAGEQKLSTVADAISGYRGMVRLKGVPESRLVRLPEKDDDADGWSQVYQRMGRPEKPDGYEIPDVVIGEGDYNLANDFRTWSHEAGLSKRQAGALAGAYQKKLTEFAAAREEAFAQRSTQEEADLKREWGAEFEGNVRASAVARQTLASHGVEISDADLDGIERSIGLRKVMQLFALVGRSMGEHRSVNAGDQGREQPFGLTPAAADAKANELTSRLMSMKRGDPTYLDVFDEINRLRALARNEQVPDFLRRPGPKAGA